MKHDPRTCEAGPDCGDYRLACAACAKALTPEGLRFAGLYRAADGSPAGWRYTKATP